MASECALHGTSVGSASNSSLDVHPQVLPSPGRKEGHLVLDHKVWEQAVLRVVETVFASDFPQFPCSQKGRFQDRLEILEPACEMKGNRTTPFARGSVCSIFCSCVGVPLCSKGFNLPTIDTGGISPSFA